MDKEKGAFAIDALLGITMFLASIMAIMMISLIIRTEAKMQYAIDQTAKELSSYYYLMSKMGINIGNSTEGKADDVNEMVDNVFSFMSESGDAVGGIDISNSLSENIASVNADDAKAMIASGEKLWNSLKTVGSNPQEQIKSVLSVISGTGLNTSISYIIATPLCRMIMPKYISSNYELTDKYLEQMGIEEGIEGINFHGSDFLADGKSINIIAVYKINTKSLTFGMIDAELDICQSASTAAWKYDTEAMKSDS